jgi:hypothetical protein
LKIRECEIEKKQSIFKDTLADSIVAPIRPNEKFGTSRFKGSFRNATPSAYRLRGESPFLVPSVSAASLHL